MELLVETVNKLKEELTQLRAEFDTLLPIVEGLHEQILAGREQGREEESEDDIEDVFVDEGAIAKELYEPSRFEMCQFILDLQKVEYKDNPDEMGIVVDKRIIQAKVNSMKENFLEFFDVSESLRELLWKDMKEVLNEYAHERKKWTEREQRATEAANNSSAALPK
ncbi:hypothetical protein OSTOST_09126 [Ostertagia ostertagi]